MIAVSTASAVAQLYSVVPGLYDIRIEIAPTTGAAVLVDLGSRNGTILNVKRLRGQAALEPGDLIRIGKTVLRYVPAGAGPVARAAAT